MKKIIMTVSLICIILIGFGCTNQNNAKRILEQNGYEDINFTGYSFFACADKDFYHTGFKAKNISSGKIVEGTVCEGLLFKNSTIRFK